MAEKKKHESFESALQRIEEIAAQMEPGDLPLDQLVVVYEEGLRLIRFCSERLDEAEKRLQTITRNAAGQPQGLAPVPTPAEISAEIPPSGRHGEATSPSTPPQPSATGKPASAAGDPPARLF